MLPTHLHPQCTHTQYITLWAFSSLIDKAWAPQKDYPTVVSIIKVETLWRPGGIDPFLRDLPSFPAPQNYLRLPSLGSFRGSIISPADSSPRRGFGRSLLTPVPTIASGSHPEA